MVTTGFAPQRVTENNAPPETREGAPSIRLDSLHGGPAINFAGGELVGLAK